jgi:MFS family permease
MLSLLKYVFETKNFLILSFAAKVILGLGAGMNATASKLLVTSSKLAMAILASEYQEDKEQMIGLCEAASGVGLLMGPLMGAGLYEIGGYILPFATLALLYFLTYPMLSYTLLKINKESKQTPRKRLKPEVKVMSLLTNRRFFFGCISQIVVYSSITYLQPILALHLQMFGYSGGFIGLCFAIPTLIYASTAPLVFLLTSRLQKRSVIFIGYSIISCALFLIGPSKWLGLQQTSTLIILGLCVLGLGGGMTIIPVLPEMILAIEDDPELDVDEYELNEVISGIFVASQGIGETVGPILGSTLVEGYGF